VHPARPPSRAHLTQGLPTPPPQLARPT
jgi:hypothetical protein